MIIYHKPTQEYTGLIERAVDAMDKAYAPYSDFLVGAALECENGNIYTGCNIENASYPAGICAERSAVSCAVSNGDREFTRIAIVGGERGKIRSVCAPCGICRQVLREFCDPKNMLVILYDGEGIYEYTLEELLPMSFGPESLE